MTDQSPPTATSMSASSTPTSNVLQATSSSGGSPSSFLEFGNYSMLVEDENKTKWFSNLFYAQEWQVSMNAYKINETGILRNGS